MRQKTSSVHRDYGDFSVFLELRSRLRISVLAYMEIKNKEYKCTVSGAYVKKFPVYGEYAGRHKIEPI
jgi:hypothetical protein